MFNPEAPPELAVDRWLNTDGAPSLKSLAGKVIVLGAFQLHCPGSSRHLIPQMSRLAAQFAGDEVAVLGFNTVFEETDKQKPADVEDFIRDSGIEFPVAIDRANGGPLPETMEAYGMQGTPTLLVFDRQGRLRRHYLGQVDDMRIAAEIMAMAMESRDAPREQSIAVERRLAAVLIDPEEHHHDHEGGCCGGHGHSHDHHHDHDHAHGGGCCGGHAHGHDHAHDHDHGPHHHAHDHGKPAAKAEGSCNGDGSCGCKG